MSGVFVLDAQGAVAEPRAVISMLTPANNHRDLGHLPAVAPNNLARPAPLKTEHGRWHHEIDGVAFLIGKHQIVNTILVQIDESDAVVLTLVVHNGHPVGERIRKALPGLIRVSPGEHGVLRFIGNDQVGHAVAVHITQSRAAVASALGREHRFAVEHKSIEQRGVRDPFSTVEPPGAGLGFVPRKHDGLVGFTYNAKAHTGVLMT